MFLYFGKKECFYILGKKNVFIFCEQNQGEMFLYFGEKKKLSYIITTSIFQIKISYIGLQTFEHELSFHKSLENAPKIWGNIEKSRNRGKPVKIINLRTR